MSFFSEVGVLTSRTSPGTDVVTLTSAGASLDVKLIQLVLNSATATGGANANYAFAMGFSDGTDERCVDLGSTDDVATTESRRSAHDDSVLSIYSSAHTLLDQATISAIGNGTFTINWTTKSANAYKIGWTTWGGSDITDVEIGTLMSATSTGAANYTTTIKSANFGFFLSPAFFGSLNTSANNIINGIGVADGNGNQGSSAVSSPHGVGTSTTSRFQATDSCISALHNDAIFLEAALTAFDASNGIQLNWTTVQGTARALFYVLIKGGRWEVGNGTTNTSAATKAYTTTFQPVGVSTFGVNNTVSGSVVAHNHLSFGSSDGATSYSFSTGDNDNIGTTETGLNHSTANVVQTFTSTELTAGGGIASLVGEGTFDSFNATDFTLDFTGNADSALREFIWMVCAGSSGILVHPGMSGGMDDLLGGLRA